MGLSRRTLLGAVTAVGVAPAATGSASADPTAADWRALAAGLAGALFRPDDPGYDRARQLTDPRYDGVRPPAVARCAEPADIAEAVRFAARFGVPVVARGGGHSYVGASVSRTALVVDTRPLARVAYDAASRTAEIGGGARLADIYAALARYGRSVPAGSCGTVGIGGLALGGGIGMASSLAGLTCDAVTGLELVGADGRHRAVDAAREPELFWACRGGGGGQVGVVTGWRMRTFGVSDVGVFKLRWRWSDAAAVAVGWQRFLATMPDSTWCHLQVSSDAHGRCDVRVSGYVLAGDPGPAVRALVAAARRDPVEVTSDRDDYLAVVRARGGGAVADRQTELLGSDVFARPLPPRGVAALLAAVRRRAASRQPGVAKLKPLTNAVARVPRDATAFPWRGAHAMLQWLVIPPSADPATVRSAYAWIADGHRAVAEWSVGRYVNYLEPDRAALGRCYGPHLARMRRARARFDPHRLFRSPYSL
jgi:FAD/FMN-containing dehydrogenase